MSLPLEDALRQCALHAKRLARAAERIGFPLQAGQLEAENEELVTLLDQFVFRLIKLQDTMGTHVLRGFCLQVLFEPLEDASLVDVLVLLEQRGYLTLEDWQLQRALRNDLTHEYPERSAWQRETMNRAFEKSLQLTAWLNRFTTEFTQRIAA
jgi:branched-subunit amino acid aminotransferase/4-amino-4-deoxychorismate lyase